MPLSDHRQSRLLEIPCPGGRRWGLALAADVHGWSALIAIAIGSRPQPRSPPTAKLYSPARVRPDLASAARCQASVKV